MDQLINSSFRFRSVFLIIFLFLLSGCAHQTADLHPSEPFYINGFDAQFRPFSFINRSGKPDGLDIKALDWIAKEMGFNVKHQPMNWNGIILRLNERKIDIIASGMTITDERKKEVAFTIPNWKLKQVLVAKKDTKLITETALADGNKIGVRRGTSEAKWIEENLIKKDGKKIELAYYNTFPLAVEDLLNGKIVAVAMNDIPANYYVKNKPVKILDDFGMPDTEFAYAIRKEDTEFFSKVNEGLIRLMKSQYWNELVKTYIEKW